jgi:hypothetical protein
MPIGGYFGGHGTSVMSDMKKRYGSKKGESIFYATANKKDQKPKTHPAVRGLRSAKPR